MDKPQDGLLDTIREMVAAVRAADLTPNVVVYHNELTPAEIAAIRAMLAAITRSPHDA